MILRGRGRSRPGAQEAKARKKTQGFAGAARATGPAKEAIPRGTGPFAHDARGAGPRAEAARAAALPSLEAEQAHPGEEGKKGPVGAKGPAKRAEGEHGKDGEGRGEGDRGRRPAEGEEGLEGREVLEDRGVGEEDPDHEEKEEGVAQGVEGLPNAVRDLPGPAAHVEELLERAERAHVAAEEPAHKERGQNGQGKEDEVARDPLEEDVLHGGRGAEEPAHDEPKDDHGEEEEERAEAVEPKKKQGQAAKEEGGGEGDLPLLVMEKEAAPWGGLREPLGRGRAEPALPKPLGQG